MLITMCHSEYVTTLESMIPWVRFHLPFPTCASWKRRFGSSIHKSRRWLVWGSFFRLPSEDVILLFLCKTDAISTNLFRDLYIVLSLHTSSSRNSVFSVRPVSEDARTGSGNSMSVSSTSSSLNTTWQYISGDVKCTALLILLVITMIIINLPFTKYFTKWPVASSSPWCQITRFSLWEEMNNNY